jgi:hypothetical protein
MQTEWQGDINEWGYFDTPTSYFAIADIQDPWSDYGMNHEKSDVDL